MTALQQISKLASDILQSSNNELRITSEKILIEKRDANPDELVVLFLGLLESKVLVDQQLRGVVPVFMRDLT